MVSNQRYRRDGLSVERKRRLDKVGFVWSGRDFAWERGFAALLKFKRREGHCRIRGLHREGDYKLRWWVAVQRKKERNVAQTESAVKQDRLRMESI